MEFGQVLALDVVDFLEVCVSLLEESPCFLMMELSIID